MICSQGGWGNGVLLPSHMVYPSSGKIVLVSSARAQPTCTGSETDISQCPNIIIGETHPEECGDNHDIGMACDNLMPPTPWSTHSSTILICAS